MNNEFVGDVMYQAMTSKVLPYLNELADKDQKWYPRKLCKWIAFNTLYHSLFGKQIDINSQIYKELMHDFEVRKSFYQGQELLCRNFVPLRYMSIGKRLLAARNRKNGNIEKLIKMRIEDKKDTDDGIETYVDFIHKLVEQGKITFDDEVGKSGDSTRVIKSEYITPKD